MPIPTISGKYLVGTVNGVLVTGLQGWTVRETGDQLDGTTGSDAGFENDDIGVERAEIDMEIVQNIATGIYTIIRMGNFFSNLKLYRSFGDNQPAFTFPAARVYESTNMGKVKERFTTAVKARSNGTYTVTDPGAG